MTLFKLTLTGVSCVTLGTNTLVLRMVCEYHALQKRTIIVCHIHTRSSIYTGIWHTGTLRHFKGKTQEWILWLIFACSFIRKRYSSTPPSEEIFSLVTRFYARILILYRGLNEVKAGCFPYTAFHFIVLGRCRYCHWRNDFFSNNSYLLCFIKWHNITHHHPSRGISPSHLAPVNPSRQTHSNNFSPCPGLHLPPFSHGLGLHGSPTAKTLKEVRFTPISLCYCKNT